MRDGDTGRAWPVRAEGSSCVVTSGLWTVQRLRHDNTQRKDTYTETGDILLIFWVTSEAWRRVTRAQWALTISRINHHQRVTQIFSERKKFFCNFSCCQVLQCCHCWSLLQSNSYFMHISKFCLHILWLQKNSVSLISVGTESRFRDSIVRLMSSCYLGWWILTHVLVWISHWLSFQWMSVIPHLSIVLISSWCGDLNSTFYFYRNRSCISWKPDPNIRVGPWSSGSEIRMIWSSFDIRFMASLLPPPPSPKLHSTWNCKQRNTERCDAIQTLNLI